MSKVKITQEDMLEMMEDVQDMYLRLELELKQLKKRVTNLELEKLGVNAKDSCVTSREILNPYIGC